ncbi:MAG: hypothetical protein D6706_15765 [Chloroflexi bacterium]|nr:MAG: hypothetical protein D6706_15765 [Chloroflexota bacterium]
MDSLKITLISLAVLALIALFVIQCMPPKERGRILGNEYEYNLGPLPDDICMAGGVPQIISVNTESQAGYALTYVDTQGRLVIQQYLPAPLKPSHVTPAGKVYWTGGRCVQ